MPESSEPISTDADTLESSATNSLDASYRLSANDPTNVPPARATLREIVNPAPVTAPSSAAHRQKLYDESGIDPSVVAERGYRTINHNNSSMSIRMRNRGWTNVASAIRRGAVLEIPVFRYNGESTFQYRPDVPREERGEARRRKIVKYESPVGVAIFPDVHPRIRTAVTDPRVPLWFTEGVLKADAAISRGLVCVALAGVDMYRDPGAPVPRLHPDFDAFALRGRSVFVCFDSDVMVKDGVRRALTDFYRLLQERGADVKLVYLPSGPHNAKVGLDDYFVAGGTVEELLALARDGTNGGWELDIKRMSDVAEREIEWLWERRLPKGQVTLIAGDGGIGKSYLTLGIAAAVSRGSYLPGDSRRLSDAPRPEPGSVLIVNYEDGLGDGLETIMARRVRLSGCDPERIFVLDGERGPDGRHRPFSIESIPMIERYLDDHPDVQLLVIDPVMAFIGSMDANRDNEVRAALLPLHDVVSRRAIVCILVAHLRKADAEQALQRVAGSSGFVNSVRSVGLAFWEEELGDDGEVENRTRMLSFEKHNLTGESEAIPFFVEDDGSFAWGEPKVVTADDHLTSRGRSRQQNRSSPNVERVRAWLREIFPEDDYDRRVPSRDVDSMLSARGVKKDSSSYKKAKLEEQIKSVRHENAWFMYRERPESEF